MSKNLGKSLDDAAMKQLNARQSTVVLATVSGDGYPNTTPVHLAIARDPQTLLMGVSSGHRAITNIRANPKVMVSLCEQNDLNISIRGDARIIREKLACNPGMCAVEVKINAIKDDSTHSRTTAGIRYECKTDRGAQFIQDVFDELERL
jgi:predicted pyridoxine 5'-phosphate oxidase superfamily flavin-nucleotide-binding protein